MKNKEFSKILLLQESVLIWIMSISFLILAFYCINSGYLGTLPWLTAMVSLPWAAYGVSQVYYYKKSLAENTEGGIKFQSFVHDLEAESSENQDGRGLDFIEEILDPQKENPDNYQI